MKTIKKLFLTAALVGTTALSAHAEGKAALVKVVAIKQDAKETKIYANLFDQTLYTFDQDAGSVSNCNGTCAEKWPPYLLEDDEVDGLAAPFASIKRANGLLQLTINGKPVYTFYEDRKSGDITGDGLGDVWHIVPAL